MIEGLETVQLTPEVHQAEDIPAEQALGRVNRKAPRLIDTRLARLPSPRDAWGCKRVPGYGAS